jgi:hypothetical protein
MSSDNQFTALGPTIIGFQTDGANIDIGAQISGNTVGIKGSCQGSVGDGVEGTGTGNFSGVAGWGGANSGTGVIGFGAGADGPGVRGIGSGGPNTGPAGPAGVYGQGGNGAPGVNGQGGNGAPGVVGQAGAGIADGVDGFATGNFSGVAGFGGPNAGTGVFGLGGTLTLPDQPPLTGPGVRGIGGSGPNTVPQSSNGLVSPVGVYGQGASGADGVRGVAGQGPGGPDSWAGVHGVGGAGPPAPGFPASFAGLFDGAVQINGNLSVSGTVTKGGGAFQIDHPLDPTNKYLVHSFVESPDMKNIYDGVAVANALGEVTVELPEYFDALNKNFRYQLTPIGAPTPNLHVKQELIENRFTIAGAAPGQRVCWQVSGTRKDAWALANPIVVEREKPKSERRHFASDTFDILGGSKCAHPASRTRMEADSI